MEVTGMQHVQAGRDGAYTGREKRQALFEG